MSRMKRLTAAIVFAVVFTSVAAAKDNLAVLPFTGGVGEEGETIAELFSFSNELNAIFTPIPRTSISRAIGSEQNFQTSTGMTDPDTIAALGKQLGAKYVVAGNIAKLGDRNLLIISILKIDDLRQVAGDIETYGRIEEIQDKLPVMARNIIAAIQVDSSKFEKLAVLPVALGGGNIDTRVADTLAQILSINLIRSGKYAVYPRTATLEQVQAEYSTQLSGVVADKDIVDIGKADNPRIVLSVAARRLGSRNMFNASLIDLESAAQLVGRSVNYNTLDDGITAMENLAEELTKESEPARKPAESAKSKRGKQSGGAVYADSGLDSGPSDAVFGYGALNLAFGLGSFIQGDRGGGLTLLAGYGAAAGLLAWDLTLAYEDELAGIPGGVGLWVAGFAALYGFIRPVVFNNNRSLAEIIDRIDIAVVPGNDGRATARLACTVKF